MGLYNGGLNSGGVLVSGWS